MVIHDWIFEVHRCHRLVPPEIAQITFEQSAHILAEVGKALIEHGLVKHNLLEEIVWAVRTRYARGLWEMLFAHLKRIFRLDRLLCVPKTLSELIGGGNHLTSAHNDRAAMLCP
jgi:hypothetical protein